MPKLISQVVVSSLFAFKSIYLEQFTTFDRIQLPFSVMLNETNKKKSNPKKKKS